MQKQDLIEYFGSTHKLAGALAINQSAIVRWQDTVPAKQVTRLSQMVDKDYLKLFGKTLIDNGYKIVPIREGSKSPNLRDWTSIDATYADVDNWVRGSFQGVGILCEHTPAIDIDVHDKRIVDQLINLIESECGKVVLTRVGQAPKVIIPFRVDTPVHKQTSPSYVDINGKLNRVEVLGKGQQFVAFGTHPETKCAYQWTSEESLLTVIQDQLPLLTQTLIDSVFAHFPKIVPSTWIANKAPALTPTKSLDNVKNKPSISESQLFQALTVIPADEYDTWLKVGMALYEHYDGQHKGLALWDNWSSNADNYDADILKAKWQSFKTSTEVTNAVTAKTILALATTVRKADYDVKMQQFYEHHYYVVTEDAVLDTRLARHKEPLPIANFLRANLNFYRLEEDPKRNIKRIQIAEEWLKNDNRKTLARRDYRPDKPQFFNDDDGEVCYNTFYWPEHQKAPQPIDLKPFYIHLELLFPLEKEREWFLDWMAFTLQAPHIRSPITPLHISPAQGLGRGILVELLAKLVGAHNIGKCEIDNFNDAGSKSQYNDYLYRTILCVMEETNDQVKNYTLADKTKSLLTDVWQRSSIKYTKNQLFKCYTNFLWFSNNINAITLDDNDRRFNIFLCDKKPLDARYYGQLACWLGREEVIAEIFYMLKNRPLDIDAFKAQKPMKNEAKKRLIRESKSETELALDEFLAAPPAAWMTFQQIKKQLDGGLDEFESPISVQQLKLLLKRSQLTYKPEELKIKIKGKYYNHWCVDVKTKHWDNDQIREEILKHPL